MAKDGGSISVEIVGLSQLEAAFAASPEIVGRQMKLSIQAAMILLQRAARQFVVRDTSRLADAIRTVPIGNFTGKITAQTQYAIYVHEGTGPHWPPLDAVEPWARRHGIPAFVVARSIAAKGTKANPFFDLARKETQPDVDKIFTNTLDQIIKQLVK